MSPESNSVLVPGPRPSAPPGAVGSCCPQVCSGPAQESGWSPGGPGSWPARQPCGPGERDPSPLHREADLHTQFRSGLAGAQGCGQGPPARPEGCYQAGTGVGLVLAAPPWQSAFLQHLLWGLSFLRRPHASAVPFCPPLREDAGTQKVGRQQGQRAARQSRVTDTAPGALSLIRFLTPGHGVLPLPPCMLPRELERGHGSGPRPGR